MSLANARAVGRYQHLTNDNHTVTSAETDEYNCIAWAYGVVTQWFWPNVEGGTWPPGIPNEATLEAFVALFASIDYESCDDGSLESNYEKVAIYANAGAPTHAARQLESGLWTSKIGTLEDIEHQKPENVEDRPYGHVVQFMRRPRRNVVKDR